MRQMIGRAFGNKISRDIAWTMASFIVLASSGILINVIVAYFRGAEALGIFNQAYSVYIIGSQIAAFGIHYSVLRSAAHHESDKDELGRILMAGIVPALALGLLVAALIWALESVFARLFSDSTARAISFAALGLALFPTTKVLIAFLNGLREMKAFAILQASRYILVAVVVALISASDLAFPYASLSFLLAELATMAAATSYILLRRLSGSWKLDRNWLNTHLRFGGKSLAAGMLGEINTRVDVLCLGLLLNDTAVGIYSFAAMLVDGLYHLLAMVRVNFNPLLVSALRDSAWLRAQELATRTRLYAPLATAGLSLCVLFFYWIVTGYVVPDRGLQVGLPSLIILLASLTLVSPFVPFDNMLLVGGYPSYQTLQQFVGVTTNAVLNVLLIPLMGMEGSAVGTGASFVAAAAVLIVLTKRFFRWNLITNTVAV